MESVQPIIMLNPDNKTPYSGVAATTLDDTFGAGSVAVRTTLATQQYLRVRRNATGDNVFGHTLGFHNFIHPFLDPEHKGPPYIMRISQVIIPIFDGSVGRVFFGLGGFTDVTDASSLRGAGFYCDETGNWIALLADANGDRVRFDTSADTNQPRFLRMDIDANFKTVRWYVDEVIRTTHVVATVLDQLDQADGSGLLAFNSAAIQSDAGNQIDAFIAAGIVAQMSIITDEPNIAAAAAGAAPGGVVCSGLTWTDSSDCSGITWT